MDYVESRLHSSCPVDVDLALADWEYVRGGGTRNWQIDYSRPIASSRFDIEAAQQEWRARQVDEAIGSLGPTRFIQRILSDLMATTVTEPDRKLEHFRVTPRGHDGTRLVREQIRIIRETIEARLRVGKGYPQP